LTVLYFARHEHEQAPLVGDERRKFKPNCSHVNHIPWEIQSRSGAAQAIRRTGTESALARPTGSRPFDPLCSAIPRISKLFAFYREHSDRCADCCYALSIHSSTPFMICMNLLASVSCVIDRAASINFDWAFSCKIPSQHDRTFASRSVSLSGFSGPPR
jgi:hypothetical protein